jgi:hypothetical protein
MRKEAGWAKRMSGRVGHVLRRVAGEPALPRALLMQVAHPKKPSSRRLR